MPYFHFHAETPFCGESSDEYIFLEEDELDQVDTLQRDIANDLADMYWDDEDCGYTQEEYYEETWCEATEVSKEEFEANK